MRTLNTVRDVVKALGGPAKLGRDLRIGQPAVSNWLAKDDIPNGWHLRLYLKLIRNGYRVNPVLFDVDDESAVWVERVLDDQYIPLAG